MRGGRFDIFEHAWKRTQGEEMHVTDANSVYASIACSNEMPTGPYEIETDWEKLQSICLNPRTGQHELNGEKMIGIVYLEIESPKTCNPFIGVRVLDQYIHALCTECATEKRQKICRHGHKKRNITATLTWPEVNYMVADLGYTIINIYEVYQWKETADVFSKFLKLLARFKLMHESPSYNESNTMFCDTMNQNMMFPNELRLCPRDIKPDKSLRNVYKEILCSILGKMAQQNCRTQTRVLKTQSSLNSLFYSPDSKIEDVYVVGKACVAITSCKKNNKLLTNPYSSPICYMYITALSRIFMHRNMILLEQRACKIIAIMNDCLYFRCPIKTQLPFQIGKHFGAFKHEYNSNEIMCFISFGIKCNAIYLEKKGKSETIIKARGFTLKSHFLKEKLNFQLLLSLFNHDNPARILVPQVRTKKVLKKMAVTQKLQISSLTNKVKNNRILLPNLSTLPFGYQMNWFLPAFNSLWSLVRCGHPTWRVLSASSHCASFKVPWHFTTKFPKQKKVFYSSRVSDRTESSELLRLAWLRKLSRIQIIASCIGLLIKFDCDPIFFRNANELSRPWTSYVLKHPHGWTQGQHRHAAITPNSTERHAKKKEHQGQYTIFRVWHM